MMNDLQDKIKSKLVFTSIDTGGNIRVNHAILYDQDIAEIINICMDKAKNKMEEAYINNGLEEDPINKAYNEAIDTCILIIESIKVQDERN